MITTLAGKTPQTSFPTYRASSRDSPEGERNEHPSHPIEWAPLENGPLNLPTHSSTLQTRSLSSPPPFFEGSPLSPNVRARFWKLSSRAGDLASSLARLSSEVRRPAESSCGLLGWFVKRDERVGELEPRVRDLDERAGKLDEHVSRLAGYSRWGNEPARSFDDRARKLATRADELARIIRSARRLAP
jgi:hypothetical protein